jgi:hypothetical protein
MDDTGDYSYDYGSTPVQGAASGSNVPAPTSSAPNWLAVAGTIEDDFIYAFRAVTQPSLPPGQVGVTVAGGNAGSTISISPVLLIAIVAIAWFAFQK